MMLKASRLDVAIADVAVCKGLELGLAAGESLAILGRNGAGKSTLLATFAGLRHADAGGIVVDGIALPAADGRALALRRGYLPQQQVDAFATTVLEAVLAGRHPHLSRWQWESPDDNRIAAAALAEVGLAGFADRQLATLSGGERQRVALATLLAQAPGLYLLDEPLAHLDLNHQIAVLEVLAGLCRRGRTVVAVLHDPNLALRYCGRALLLFGGGEWLEGPAADVLTAENLSRLYGHPLRRLDDSGRPVFVPL
jgi:iron complex transport system ATP-binding protein